MIFCSRVVDFSVFVTYNIVRPGIHDVATSSNHRRQIFLFVTDVSQTVAQPIALQLQYAKHTTVNGLQSGAHLVLLVPTKTNLPTINPFDTTVEYTRQACTWLLCD
jgi:hypothetical protein